MDLSRLLTVLSAALAVVLVPACRRSGQGDAETAGKFVIVDIRTDNADLTAAKQNAANALQLYTDLAGMVGLYGYNTPACLDALREAQKNGNDVLGRVQLFGFDGQSETLAGIEAGHVAGTVIQEAFEFGYQSMKVLKAIHDGTPVESRDGVIDIPVRVLTKDTVGDYRRQQSALLESARNAAAPPSGAVTLGFITNNQSSFWEEARAGCLKAQEDFGIAVDFQMPDSQDAAAQNRILESMMQRDVIKGVAVSVVSPEAQTGLLTQMAERMPLVTHDSDAPKSPRKFYLGTNNYDAGRALAKLIKEKLPDGGRLMIFVGSIDAMNAAERLRGLKDELSAG